MKSQPQTTDQIIGQGQVLVRATEALETIKPTVPFERVQARFLLQANRGRLRTIVEAAPSRMGEEILSADQHIDEERSAVWLSRSCSDDSVHERLADERHGPLAPSRLTSKSGC